MVIKIGITGGIGSGKSVVSKLLRAMSIPVYLSDDEAKRLTATDETIRKELTALLGDELYQGNVLNKSLLAGYLFASPENAARVNAIIHPVVKQDFRRWCKENASSFILAMESAILIEAGFASEVDAVVMVYAPKEVRIRRAMKRDGASRKQIEQRIQNQMDDEVKRAKADYTIINDDKTPLIPQVFRLLFSVSQK
ncbi:MAG: dephospho-CoA kinase [Mediterranea massiliensis]|nr:dephospho-CoA kinase [Mediterranea massiliensis]